MILEFTARGTTTNSSISHLLTLQWVKIELINFNMLTPKFSINAHVPRQLDFTFLLTNKIPRLTFIKKYQTQTHSQSQTQSYISINSNLAVSSEILSKYYMLKLKLKKMVKQ